MKTLLPHPILSLVLWLLWLLLNNTFAPGHMLLGAVLAIILPFITRSFWPENIRIQHPLKLLKFILIVLWDILIANIQVARLILGKNDSLKSTFIEIPLEIEQPISISLLANTISLTPGTVSCDVSEDKKTLIVHALHSPNPEETISEIKQRYEQPLKKVFESC
ncbi:Na+/H+ antiporter subunit E [Thiomicrorhabdus indica]|uniref:Na+/H+ antiporter subunit E n=1 Tax=Thiomicrorhabdus indica TaxID=2267253 RepID=UPI00102DA8C7|nr:Na+/H+ antiporter subunit E [Thiomicrorhabdus indica]